MKEQQDGGNGCGETEHAEAAGGAPASQAPSANPAANQGAAGAMNAYDIPRYDSQGYVLGRPETASDPMSAGMVQGAPSGEPSQAAGGYGGPTQAPQSQPAPGSGSMGHGTMNAANGQTMAGSAPGGQPGDQPPQGMVYGTMNPAYGQAMAGGAPMGQPGMQPPPGMAYMAMDPMYGQAGMQPPPQAPEYMTMGQVYFQPMAGGAPAGQPGVQPPPGMIYHPGVDPAYAASAGAANPYATHPGAQQAPGTAEPAVEGGNAEHYSRIADVVNDIANGEQPDMSKLAALYSGFDTQFWKGALIGAVLAVLLTSNTVKTAAAGTMGAIFGALNKNDGPSDAGSASETDAP